MDSYSYLRIGGYPFTRSLKSFDEVLPARSFDRHNVLASWLCCSTGPYPVEVPVMLMWPLYKALSGSRNSPRPDWDHPEGMPAQLALPLPKYDEFTGRTSSSILNEFFVRAPMLCKLKKVTTSRKQVFYGGPGVILSDKLECLMLYSFHVTSSKKDDYGNLKMYFDEAIVRVSPEVLTSRDPLSRTIVKNVIPPLCDPGGLPIRRPWLVPQDRDGEEVFRTVPKIIVGHIPQSLCRRPETPESHETLESSMREFLKRDDIIEDIARGI